ncbi:DUF6161 domain-containing protein [Altererythrobacter arenosus]|uniref:DUF6161 domain-containing protein n=1 Tax=Altererythrobacter arenosus TaxID=3032592 RepID=A0ABY8FNI9_9SPHN|nr:DUF6161 domain-containing protein [Altererythrobacter sp. CAU 1644]WFL76587.1 DUF6161 domain-containing protein [Altererythrobacter sp. CAU 1644]
MSEATPWLRLDGEHIGEPLVFYSQEDAGKWVNAELVAWEWLWTEPRETGSLAPNQFLHHRNGFDALLSHLSGPLEPRSQAFSQFDNALRNMFNPANANSVPHSRSAAGSAVLAIKEAQGADVGRWAYQFHVRGTAFNQVGSATDYPLYLAAILHHEDIFSSFGDTLKKERSRYRTEITRLQNKVRELEKQRIVERERDRQLARKLVRRLLRQTKRVWEVGTLSSAKQVAEAIGSITETEHQYRAQMALMAPVQYWKDKAKVHGKWEAVYAATCLLYFFLAGLALWQTAGRTIDFLQGISGEGQASAYVITAGAILGGTTLLFWLGRVLVKLFLSEHHLRSESSEKAIMTQAYLSMETSEAKFGETDRAIVLASIFKSSPDGIVKDEGPTDLAGTALLARLLSR